MILDSIARLGTNSPVAPSLFQKKIYIIYLADTYAQLTNFTWQIHLCALRMRMQQLVIICGTPATFADLILVATLSNRTTLSHFQNN